MIQGQENNHILDLVSFGYVNGLEKAGKYMTKRTKKSVERNIKEQRSKEQNTEEQNIIEQNINEQDAETNVLGVRLNKYLSEAGVCSRREADRFIEQGKVKIDGVRAEIGTRVMQGQRVIFQNKDITKEEEFILIALNKPRGIVCTTAKSDPDNIIDFMKFSKRIYPIGRLDKDSEGLLLMTNDGNIVNKILKAGNYHEKEYIVTVNKQITADFIEKMSGGVPILETVTRPCEVTIVNKNTFKIILTQGLNRQIRRMCEYLEYRVVKLQRIRVMNIKLGRLNVGGYRNVTDRELETLLESIKE